MDGEQLIKLYRNLGLQLDVAPNAVEAGIYQCWTRLSSGRMKVFKSLKPFFEEFRVYRRDEKGRVVKDNDHLMDAMRMFVLACVQSSPQFSWLKPAKAKPTRSTRQHRFEGRGDYNGASNLAWMR